MHGPLVAERMLLQRSCYFSPVHIHDRMVLAPICPHSLTYRPLVISPKSKITLRLLPPFHTVNLTLDGQVVFPIEETDLILINHKKAKRVSLIKNDSRSFFETLKEKFVHGRRS